MVGLTFFVSSVLSSTTLWAEHVPDPDLNNDGVVNVLDLSMVGSCFGLDPATNPQCEIADINHDGVVGFGDLTLDYSDQVLIKSNVTATVGAGNLEILVPKRNSPIKIVVHNSPLCHVKISKSFDEVEDNVFVNSSYTPDAENLLTFNLDVALGNIVFKEVR